MYNYGISILEMFLFLNDSMELGYFVILFKF